MALYIAPLHNKAEIEVFLSKNYPGRALSERGLAFHEAHKLVMQTCEDATLAQPAVKLLSPHDSLKYTAMFGTILLCNGDFVEMISADHSHSKFLFNGDGVDRRTVPWVLIELIPLPQT